MRHLQLLTCTVLLTHGSVVLAAPAPAAPRSVLLVPLDIQDDSLRQLGSLTTAAMASLVGRVPGYRVLTTQEVQKSLSQEQQRQLAGCDSEGCAATLADALNSDELVMGTAGMMGDAFLLTLGRVRARDGVVLRRHLLRAQVGREDSILDQLLDAVTDLFGVPVADAGAAGPRQAAARYAEALQLFRDGKSSEAALADVVRLDPDHAAAHLRMALANFQSAPARARVHHQHALRLRASLSPEDAALLHGSAAVFADPPDLPAWEKGLARAVAAFPHDVFIQYHLGISRQLQARFDAAVEVYDGILARDPTFAWAWWLKSQVRFYLQNRPREALALADQCVAALPYAAICLKQRAGMQVEMGEAAALLATGRAVVANDPRSMSGYLITATALQCTGAGPDETMASLARGWRASGRAAALQLADRYRWATAHADFEAAETFAVEALALAENSEEAAEIVTAALRLAHVQSEMGRTTEAVAVLKAAIGRLPALTDQPLSSGSHADLKLALAGPLLELGAMTPQEFAVLQDHAVAGARARRGSVREPRLLATQWLLALAAHASTPARARAALAALPAMDMEGVPPPGTLNASDEGTVGRVLLLAGRAPEALPRLQRAVRACDGWSGALDWMRAHEDLALAMEATGDAAGAHAVRSGMLTRWPRAPASSRLFQRIRGRLPAPTAVPAGKP